MMFMRFRRWWIGVVHNTPRRYKSVQATTVIFTEFVLLFNEVKIRILISLADVVFLDAESLEEINV